MVAADGGNVVAIEPMLVPPYGERVDYISAHGELRRAMLPRGQTAFADDKPFELVLKEDYERAGSGMLDAIYLATKYSRLPGYESYQSLVRELAAGAKDAVIIEEAGTDTTAKLRFAPILQCIEAVSIRSRPESKHRLELVVDGKNVDIHWSVEGLAPNRSLVVRAVRPGG